MDIILFYWIHISPSELNYEPFPNPIAMYSASNVSWPKHHAPPPTGCFPHGHLPPFKPRDINHHPPTPITPLLPNRPTTPSLNPSPLSISPALLPCSRITRTCRSVTTSRNCRPSRLALARPIRANSASACSASR
jgi:hypothetical protein